MARLRRSDTSVPGLRRVARGRGFQYLTADGGRPGGADLDRIRGLVIPPAWRDVWICPLPNGHLQATGVDAAGRRQYIYHADWRKRRDRRSTTTSWTWPSACLLPGGPPGSSSTAAA